MTRIKTDLYLGDCLEVLADFGDDSFDLIMTSPPYADRRSTTYGGISPDEYVNWFMPRAEEFLRVLKPSGTFILNIKEQAIDGERHTYVIELILAMKKQGWLWTEEFVWHKKNCYPGKWPNRFRDAWERCLQFNKTRRFNMYQEAVMVPMGDWAEKRLKNLSKTDQNRDTSKVGRGFGKNVSNWVDRKMAYPTNVLHLATETGNRKHSAVFPKSLPEWFIRLFTEENDWVLDPFAGSGTTCQVAQKLLRNSVGIEILPEYYQLARENIKPTQYQLFEKDRKPDKGDYLKLCGQKFWEFISGDHNLYTDIIEPLGHQAEEKNERFRQEYAKVVNKFTAEFIGKYCDAEGNMLWEEIVKFNPADTTP